MTLGERLPAFAVTTILLLAVAVIAWRFVSSGDDTTFVTVKVPELSEQARKGKQAFDANCAACHGSNAAGSEKGPPLVHDIYNPGHHSDAAFLIAAKRGVRQHHWPFGSMPAQPQATEEDVSGIIRYVRELQEANGIFYRQHTN